MQVLVERGEHCVILPKVKLGAGTRIGNFVLIRSDTNIGSNVDIEGDVAIGDRVSLQSFCYITRGVVIGHEVGREVATPCEAGRMIRLPRFVEAALELPLETGKTVRTACSCWRRVG